MSIEISRGANLSKPEKNIAGACSRVKFVIHKRSFIANCTRNMHAETGNFRWSLCKNFWESVSLVLLITELASDSVVMLLKRSNESSSTSYNIKSMLSISVFAASARPTKWKHSWLPSIKPQSYPSRKTGTPKRLYTHGENGGDGELWSKFESKQRR